MMRFILLLALVAQTVNIVYGSLQKIRRLPFQKKNVVLKSPVNYEKEIVSYDPWTNQPIYRDPRPQVALLDAKSGKYALKWIGHDSKQKTVVYQRPDAIDAVVSASVSKTASGRYTYVYLVHNLPSSGQHLAGVAVQNYASDVRPVEAKNIHIGRMAKNKEMKDGNWIRYGILSDFNSVAGPGRNIGFKLESAASPGLVECRIHGGTLGIKGVGEEMPQELANILPGYEAWPSGYTIGPVDSLKTLSTIERANYLRKNLPEFQRLGWMTAKARHWYEQNINRQDLKILFQRAERDIKAGEITAEVLAIIQGLQF